MIQSSTCDDREAYLRQEKNDRCCNRFATRGVTRDVFGGFFVDCKVNRKQKDSQAPHTSHAQYLTPACASYVIWLCPAPTHTHARAPHTHTLHTMEMVLHCTNETTLEKFADIVRGAGCDRPGLASLPLVDPPALLYAAISSESSMRSFCTAARMGWKGPHSIASLRIAATVGIFFPSFKTISSGCAITTWPNRMHICRSKVRLVSASSSLAVSPCSNCWAMCGLR